MSLYATLANGKEVELEVAPGLDLTGLSPQQIDDYVREAGGWVATVGGGGVRYSAIVALSVAEPDPTGSDFEASWYDVELMGHRQRYAYVREIRIGGRGFLEVSSWSTAQKSDPCLDCGHRHYNGPVCTAYVDKGLRDGEGNTAEEPCGCAEHHHGPDSFAGGGAPNHVELYSPTAVYCMTPITETQARQNAERPF